jgi:zinc protease
VTSGRFALPVVGPPSAVRFPPVQRRSLANGVRVWAAEHGSAPVVSVACLIEGGTASDPADRPGLASLTSSLVHEGAGGRDAIALADALARLGGHLDVETGADATTIVLTTLTKHYAAALRLLADVVRRPHLSDQDFARVRELRLSRLRQTAVSPAALADRAFIGAVFGDHPYGHGALGTTRAIDSATVDDVRAYWAATWRPARTTVVIGGLDADAACREVEAVFDSWDGSNAPRPALAAPDRPADARIFVVDRPDAPQSEVRVGHLGPARKTPDYHALVTLNALVGGQFTSRLNQNLRETRAITYGARSSFEMRRAGGHFCLESSVQADATADAAREMLRECRDVSIDGALALDEVAHAKASLTRGYVRHFETAAQITRAMTQLATYDLDHDTFDRFVPLVERLTAGDLTRAAQAYFRPADASIVIVGDATRLRSSLEALGREVVETIVEF